MKLLKVFCSPKHSLGHVKYEIEVCDGTELQKYGTIFYLPCNTTDSGPNVDMFSPSLEITNIKLVHSTFPVVEGFRSVDVTMVITDNLCNDDEHGLKDESTGMI